MSSAAPSIASEQDSSGLGLWKERERQGLADRARYEPIWDLCEAFISNRQWVGWDRGTQRVIEEPNVDDRERLTMNVITQYVWTFLGKLMADDLMPEVSARLDTMISRAYARQTREAYTWGWENEWEGSWALATALLKMATYGTSAVMVYQDMSAGRKLYDVPYGDDGKPVAGRAAAHEYMSQKFQAGEPVSIARTLKEGKICWAPLSPRNLVPPPAVEHEQHFPWLIIEQPIAIETLALTFPEAAKLQPERIRSSGLAGILTQTNELGRPAPVPGELKGHVMLKTGFGFPSAEKPDGEMIVWAGDKRLAQKDELPYTVAGQPVAGVRLLKYHPVDGRLWAIGVVEPLLGAQRQRNRSRSQWTEMKDRAGLGRVFAHKGTITEVTRPKGGIFELVEVLPGREFPQETQGVPPGAWLQQEMQMSDDDMDKISGLREVSLGQAPSGVSAYAAMAHLSEQDDKRVGPVLKHVRYEVAQLSKVTLAAMKRYWLPDKQIVLAGDDPDGLFDAFTYDASQIPDDVIVRVRDVAPLPQSPAAEVQKIFDIFDRSISSGQALPLDWLYQSLKEGKALPIPKRDMQVQIDKAQLENNLLLHGTMVQVAPYDNDELHVQQHRHAQSAVSSIPELQGYVQALEMHIQEHMAQAQSKAAQQTLSSPAVMNGGSPPAPSGASGGQGAGFGAVGANLEQALAARQQ